MTAPPVVPSGVTISEVRVSNFRALVDVEVRLGDLTLLVGANNSGKTSFLDALYAAMGAGRKSLGQDDVRIAAGEALPPKDRAITIDVRVRPAGDDGKVVSKFPSGSYWTSLWGTGISQAVESDGHEFMAFRTTLSWSAARGDYVLNRKFLKEWLVRENWLKAQVHDQAVSALQIEPIALHYIDAKRDLDDDLRKQGSFWRRLTDDLGLADADVAAVEAVLTTLNEKIVDKSEVLKHLKTNLRDIQHVEHPSGDGVEIAPVARRLRDLSKGVDVTFSASGEQAFPLTRHGMGTRSLASLLVFRAYASWRTTQAKKEDDHLHTLLALEEPEAHLHPQTQRSLFAQIRSIPGQRIVSTHSPFFAGQADLGDLRLFSRDAASTSVAQIDLSRLTEPDDVRKLRQRVLESRGDLLFSRGVVFFEGETEEVALPVWAERYWGANIHELGFSFVEVGGSGSYFPFLLLADSLGIPWYVLSDGEAQPLSSLDAALKRLRGKERAAFPNVVVLPDGNNFESQLIADGYLVEIEKALDEVFGSGHLDDYIKRLDGKKGQKGVVRSYAGGDGRKRAAFDALTDAKTKAAKPLATIIAGLDAARRFPPKVAELLKMMSKAHRLTKQGDAT